MADIQTTTYTDGIGRTLKPDVDEAMAMITPTATPFINSIKTKKTKSTNPEWLEDDLEEPGVNAQVEGFDAESADYEQPLRFGNVTQIFNKVYKVSETAIAVDQYAKKDELAYARGKAAKALARDIEWNFLNSILDAGSSGTARKMRGAFGWVDTATDNYYNFSGTPSATNHITEDILNDIMQSMFEAGIQANVALTPPAQKRKISAFNLKGKLTINADSSKKKIQEVVDIFETDFGVLSVKPAMFIEPIDSGGTLYDRVLIYNDDMFIRRILRPMKTEKLAKTGDSEKEMLVGEQTLQCRSKKAVGAIDNLTRVKVQP